MALITVLVSFFVDSVIFWVPIIPFLGPMLLDRVVFVVDLAPVFSFLESVREVDLPFVAPLPPFADPVNFTPLFVPFFLGLKTFAPFLAVGLLDFGVVRFLVILLLLFGRFDLLVPFLGPLIAFGAVGFVSVALFVGPSF